MEKLGLFLLWGIIFCCSACYFSEDVFEEMAEQGYTEELAVFPLTVEAAQKYQ